MEFFIALWVFIFIAMTVFALLNILQMNKVKKYNVNGHNVTVSSGKNTAYLEIDGKTVDKYIGQGYYGSGSSLIVLNATLDGKNFVVKIKHMLIKRVTLEVDGVEIAPIN